MLPLSLRSATAAAAIAAAVLSGCGDDGNDGDAADDGDDRSDAATFERDGFPFTFEYPNEYRLVDDPQTLPLAATADESLAIAIDESDNGVIVQRFTLNTEVDQSNLADAQQELDALIQRVDRTAAGQPGETAGFPSVSYDEVALSVPEDGESRFVHLFDGEQQYTINCQSTSEHRDAVTEVCDQAIETLTGR